VTGQQCVTVADDVLTIQLCAPGSTDIALAVTDIIGERLRQIAVEGFDVKHDDAHTNGELAFAAAAYALNASRDTDNPGRKKRIPTIWPWETGDWNPKSPERDLVRAAALILAKLERLARQKAAGVA